MEAPESPKLGVPLDGEDGKVGIIESIQDARIGLYDKKHGKAIQVKVLRKRFLSNCKVFEIGLTRLQYSATLFSKKQYLISILSLMISPE